MLRYILRTFWHYRIQTASLLIGLIAIQLGVCTGLLALHQTQVSVTEDIARYSRDVYDILVRPAYEQHNLTMNGELDYMEPNYISKGSGGISLEAWKEIKSIRDVDIAAPVSAIGYFTNSMDSLQIICPGDKAYRAQIEFITTDGYKDYALGDRRTVAAAHQPDSIIRFVVAASEQTTDFSFRGGSEEYYLSILLPPIYNFLVAVDPESESRLVGLEDSIKSGQYLTEGALKTEKISIGRPIVDAYQIPVLINASTRVPLKASVVKEELEITPCMTEVFSREDTPENRRESSGLLLNAQPLNRAEKNLDLSGYLKAFQTTGIRVETDGEISTTSQGLHRIAPATEFYTTNGIEYKAVEKDGAVMFQPVPRYVRDGQVQFHGLSAHGGFAMELAEEGQAIFQLNPIGEVDFSGIYQNELSKSPLGIYGSEQMFIEENSAGSIPADPVELHPTITPGTLQLPAAHGFTTLEAAKLLKGDNPIDAIRVRVAGVERFDEEGQARIRQVAEEIVARTELCVDIVAGTSPQQVKVDIPGYKGVAPLGTVGTWWISLGAATIIRNAFSLFASALVLAFIVVGLIFVHNRSRIYLWQRKEEVSVLHTEGWSNKAVIKLFTSEIALLWLIAAIGTLFMGTTMGGILNALPDVFIKRWVFVASIGGIVFVGSAYRTLCRSYLPVIGSNGANTAKNRPGNHDLKLISGGIGTVIRSDMLYYGTRLRSMILQLVLGGTLSLFAWFARSAASEHILPTRLGEFIYVRAGIWLSIIGISTVLLVLLTCIDSLLSYMDMRRPQLVILQQLGWQAKHLLMLILPQIVVPVALAVIIAAVLAGSIVILLYNAFSGPAWQLSGVVVASIILAALLTCGWIQILYNEQYTKRPDGKTSVYPTKVRWITVAAIVGLIVTVITSTYLCEKTFQNGKTNDEALSVQSFISEIGSEAFILTRTLAALGHRPAGTEANQKEIDLLCNWLEQTGLEVKREPVTVPPYRSLGTESRLEVDGSPVDFTALVIDLSEADADRPYILQDENPVVLSAGMPIETNITGHLVLVEASSADEFRKAVALYLEDAPLAMVGVNPGFIKAEGSAVLNLEVLDVIPGYQSENIRVDILGTSEGDEPIWVVTNHGSIGPGASDNASSAAGTAVLARHLKDNPLSVPVRIIWTAGGDAQYNGGLAQYLKEHLLSGSALAVCSLGTGEPAVFGFRHDNLFGRPRSLPPAAEDLEYHDFIRYIDPTPQHKSQLWDLDYPYIHRRLSSEHWDDMMVTPDNWMVAAEAVNKDLKIGILPAFPTGLGLRLLETKMPTAVYWRFAPYRNTQKDTIDRIKPEILGLDIYFLDRVMRQVTWRDEKNDRT